MIMTVVLLTLVSTILLDSMGTTQNGLTNELINSVIGQLNQLVRQQRHKVLAHAVRDEPFFFLKGNERGYLKTNFDPNADAAGQNVVILFDRQKNPFAWFLPHADFRGKQEMPSFFKADEVRHSGLLHEGKTGSLILPSPEGLLVLSAHPVSRTDGSGPSTGWLVYGLDVGRNWFEEMKEITGVSISPFVSRDRETDDKRLVGKSSTTDALGISRVFISRSRLFGGEAQIISADIEFESAPGVPSAGLRLSFPSVVYSAAVALRNKIAWRSIFGGIAFAAFCCLAIEHLFIKKITRMEKEFRLLARGGDSAGRLTEGSHDEFSRLAGSANRLLDTLRRQRLESETQEQLLSSVLDSASEGIMAFRCLRNEKHTISDFVLVLANKAAESMVGRTSREILGKCLLGLFPGTLSEGLFDRYVRVVETRLAEQREIYYGHDGIQGWFHISVEPWNDGLVLMFEEISSRKRVEQELKASIEELGRFNRAMIGREDRILEMKTEVNLLRSRLGLAPEYKVDSLSDEP